MQSMMPQVTEGSASSSASEPGSPIAQVFAQSAPPAAARKQQNVRFSHEHAQSPRAPPRLAPSRGESSFPSNIWSKAVLILQILKVASDIPHLQALLDLLPLTPPQQALLCQLLLPIVTRLREAVSWFPIRARIAIGGSHCCDPIDFAFVPYQSGSAQLSPTGAHGSYPATPAAYNAKTDPFAMQAMAGSLRDEGQPDQAHQRSMVSDSRYGRSWYGGR